MKTCDCGFWDSDCDNWLLRILIPFFSQFFCFAIVHRKFFVLFHHQDVGIRSWLCSADRYGGTAKIRCKGSTSTASLSDRLLGEKFP